MLDFSLVVEGASQAIAILEIRADRGELLRR